MITLAPWEKRLEEEIQELRKVNGNLERAGILLKVIPNRDGWQEFLSQIQEWWLYQKRERRVEVHIPPHCLLILYGGIAFYEYEETRFWQQFAKAIGYNKLLTTSSQTSFNQDFEKASQKLGLKILKRDGGTDYVGSTIYHIGIPLSHWVGFLDICEWSLRYDDWDDLLPDKWVEQMEKLSGNRQRLKKFLINNRDTTSAFIREMLNARHSLSKNEHITFNEFKQSCLLRQEYFDEVSETADFLCPVNPESLFKDRAQLVWDDQRYSISLHLPPVATSKLPALWKVGNLEQEASSTPDIFHLNSSAFVKSLFLKLESGTQIESQHLRGIEKWGLFDLQRNRFANLKREQLPVSDYIIISSEQLTNLSRKGFENDNNEAPINEIYELKDGKICYLTHLCPVNKSAEVSFKDNGVERKISFRSGLKIEARIFAGEGNYATNFRRYEELIKVERLPLLCLAIPFGSFDETESALQRRFQVSIGGNLVKGVWEKRHEDDFQEFYVWLWNKEDKLPRKKVFVSITEPKLGISFDYQIEMLQLDHRLSHCWENLPGAFLPMYLLAQPVTKMKEGMKWEDLLLAKEAIAPKCYLSRYVLRQYTYRGLLDYTGYRWVIVESRAVFQQLASNESIMNYCGDPAILWGLFRYLVTKVPDVPLPKIEIIDKRGELPYLQVCWTLNQEKFVRKYFNIPKHFVHIVSDLWRH